MTPIQSCWCQMANLQATLECPLIHLGVQSADDVGPESQVNPQTCRRHFVTFGAHKSLQICGRKHQGPYEQES